MKPETFDYIIIGAGAAGLHLALAMIEDKEFSKKKILILDKDKKDNNDRTWCFWETGLGKWDAIAYRIWQKGVFITDSGTRHLEMYPYRYKMVRGIDFYNHAKSILNTSTNVVWKHTEVLETKESEKIEVVCSDGSFFADHAFDSRIDMGYFTNANSGVNVLQHFKGWVIETNNEVFNPDEFVMMDYRIKYKNHTGFTYILPSSKSKALVEFTFFTPQVVEDADYDHLLNEYIRDILKVSNFTITETEKGIIPMTNYPFHKATSQRITKIGTAGSWVKPSSGYSFKNAERFSKIVIENLKKGVTPSKGIAKNRFRKYDTLFLEILENQNELGSKLFEDMYFKNSASQIFKFLDEETSIMEDLKIISSFQPAPFRKALKKHWREWVIGHRS